MSPEVVSAIIGVCGVLVSVAISFLVSNLTLRYNYKHLYADVVSKSRNHWLDEMRANIAKMIAARYCMIMSKPQGANGQPQGANRQNKNTNAPIICNRWNRYGKAFNDYYAARAEVLLRLNNREDLHADLHRLIYALDECNDHDECMALEVRILAVCEPLLKTEWDRVRREARGKE